MKKKLVLFLTVFLIGIGMATAQTRVRGTVVDEAGHPIIGATVLIKGTSQGTSTDADGHFALSAPIDATLVVSFIGYDSQEVAVRETVNVVLIENAEELEEIVVTAMGIAREKKALGYAATSIKGNEISQAQTVNPMNALAGKVAGIDISAAPGPGATQNVLIRGASSFGNNQPLYIVDGVPITNSQNRAGESLSTPQGSDLNSQVDFGSGINALNPDDIADMTILKGAAATALYGSRAANGVIMITTKSGSNTEGKIKISYDGSISLSQVGRLPLEQTQFGQGWSGDRALDENGNWGAPYDGELRGWGNIIDGVQLVKPYEYIQNRVRDFYTTGVNYSNALSFSGGTAKTDYYLSLSQNRVDGVIPTDQDSYTRYTISTRGTHRTDKVTISSSVNFSTEKTKSVASGQGTSMHRSLYEIPNDIPIVDLKDYHNKWYNLDNYFTPYGVNPYYILNENGAVQDKNKIFGKFQVDYNLLNNLKFTYRFGGDYEVSTAETHEAIIAFTPDSYNDGSSTANPGSYQEMKRERIQMNHDVMATYNGNIGDDFSLNVIGGFNANERSYNWLSGSITSIDVPGFYNLTNSRSPSVSEQYRQKRRLVGIYANADIGFRDYAYLTLTARNDWSSTLPQENNSFFYPGATFSFLLTDYLKTLDINPAKVDFLKLRVAYGQTGNDADLYYIYNRFTQAVSDNPGYPSVEDLKFPLNGVNGYSVANRLGNPDLKPEITSEFEVGAEARFFDNRLGFDFSYYNRLTKGLIEVLPKDPSSGFTSQISNLGDVRNQGIELAIDITPVRTKDFSWTVLWNYTVNKNNVERLDINEVSLAGFGGAGIYAVEGKPIGQFKIARVKKTVIDDKEYTIVDGTGMPQATANEEFIGKDVNEKFRMGFTNTFTWKGLSLAGTFDYRYGGYLFSQTKDYMHWTGSSPESVLNDRLPFLVPNSVVDNGDGTFSENTAPVNPTALHTFYSNGGFEGAEYAVISRSYLKLRNVSLAYALPRSICERLNVNSVRLSLNANNILLWTPDENPYIDPETTTFGNNIGAKFGEFNGNPTNQYYTFGVALDF
ncbi:MAG TPA: SusC/RagA family TonB-linked outer membrane protein [Porphyromonadaceae bacterium]|jgi:TonB-linked SusC/RagA family outer membrane protein|nr:SusC/RagA family TonB-linked outer membrane protein [Porphyromonadaceae bacterium]HCM22294.1 SusC/RagA family TonB-linked outer membrane protein [Porphyromonadaceae bacterium]